MRVDPGNHFTSDGMKTLVDALSASKLRELYLNGTLLLGGKYMALCRQISGAVDNMLHDDGAAALAIAIRRSRTLRTVSLKRAYLQLL